MGKVILTASGKGGTGKSMFSANLGAIYAMQGYRVVIVDMDMGLRNIDLYFGLENNVVYDAHDVMMGICSIKQALIRDERFRSLYIMGASPVKEEGALTPLHARILCEKLREEFDYVIIDAPAGIDDGLVIASAGADIAMIVTTAEYASLRNAGTLERVLLKLELTKRYLVINRINPELMQAGIVPNLEEIDQTMIPPLIGTILEDRNINISTNMGIPIVLKSNTYIRSNFEKIARRIDEIEIER